MSPSGETRAVTRTRTVFWLAFWLVLQGVGVSYGLWQGHIVDNHQQDADNREEREEVVEQAAFCADAHQRYDRFLILAEQLTEAGALVGTDAHLALLESTPEEQHAAHELIRELLPSRVQPIIDNYPPPGCDREEAEQIVEGTR